MKFNASLLREKFSIRDNEPDTVGKKLQITAPSTRMVIPLQSGNLPPEILVIRTHNMHSAVRMVGKILHDFDKRGPILNRTIPLNWQELWEDTMNHYERAYVPIPFISIYHKGKPIFERGEHHSFLDVIEKCDALNKGDYDTSIKLAENAFKQAGKNVTISYDSNVALVIDLEDNKCRCAMILRNADRTTTFNMIIEETGNEKMNAALGTSVSAAFLEGVQLAYFIGVQQEKMRRGIIKQYSAEDKHTREARERLVRLETEIGAMENRYKTRYRPERPNFHETQVISERLARSYKFAEEKPAPIADSEQTTPAS